MDSEERKSWAAALNDRSEWRRLPAGFEDRLIGRLRPGLPKWAKLAAALAAIASFVSLAAYIGATVTGEEPEATSVRVDAAGHVPAHENLIEENEQSNNGDSQMIKPTKAMTVAAAVAVSAVTQARTLALYPLNNDDVRNRLDLYDRVSGEKLTSHDVTAANGPGWLLPSNPSSDIPERMTLNYGAIGSSKAKLANPLFHSDTAGAYLSATNDWTVEGFFKFKQLPNKTGSVTWNIIAGALHGDEAKRWFVSLKYVNGAWHWHMMGKLHTEGTDPVSAAAMTDEEVGAYTNSWHHFAVTCQANYMKAGEKCATKFYIDGEPMVSYERAAITIPYSVEPKNKRFDVGGLEASGDLRAHADFDYIRISDEALAPSQFLCAGGAGRPVDTPTVGYWKLDSSADGTAIDPRPSVGATPVVGAAFHPTSGAEWANPIAGTPDQAFTGLPPNMSMLPTPPLQIANDGALLSAAGYNYLTAYGISSQLNYTNDFTIEGWMKPDHSSAFGNVAEKTQIIMGTRTSSATHGWALQWDWSAQNGWRISVFGSDNTRTFINSAPLTGDLTDWSAEWKHFALVYKMGGGTNGRGLWSFYLDGELAGNAENQYAPGVCTPDANMVIGGRNTVLNYRGALDYLRVSKAALAPPQFLNAANGMAATDVIALWPLNANKGVHLDGRDAMGNYKLLWDANTARQVAASAAKPTVTNPDATLSFRGDSRTLLGSCDFAASTSSTLALRDADVKALALSFNPMTCEFYVSRDGAPKNSLEFMFAWFSNVKYNSASSAMSFSYRSDKGFQVYDHMTGKDMNDTQFGGVANMLAADGWHHVALTRDFADGKVIYELFIDGESKGTAQGTKANSVSASNVNALFIGGRYSSEHSLNGKMSSFRVSRGVLTPSEFLCAEGGAEPEPETIAYWKDESVGGRTFPVIGWYAQNGRAFTAEGRICWDGQDGVVAGTWDETCKTGWKLCIDSSSGTPALRLYGRTLYTSPFVDATLVADVSAWLGKWRYFALQYDPAIGFCGGWKFCLDSDTPSATVANGWDPGEALMTCPQPFTLGSGEDAFRKARLSSGVLLPSDLLSPKGFLLLFR